MREFKVIETFEIKTRGTAYVVEFEGCLTKEDLGTTILLEKEEVVLAAFERQNKDYICNMTSILVKSKNNS